MSLFLAFIRLLRLTADQGAVWVEPVLIVPVACSHDPPRLPRKPVAVCDNRTVEAGVWSQGDLITRLASFLFGDFVALTFLTGKVI